MHRKLQEIAVYMTDDQEERFRQVRNWLGLLKVQGSTIYNELPQ
jgi:hypothetical protein